MADYTISIYDLRKNKFDFGLKDYEIFDENYREILNKRILDYYNFYEIGFSNPLLFKDRLNQRMDIIMSNKYNAMYRALLVEFDPLNNVKMTETFTRNVSNESSGESSASSTNTNDSNGNNINSIYPNESMIEGNLLNGIYANSGTFGKNESLATSENKNKGKENRSGTETYTRHSEGSSAGLPFSKAMLQYYDFLNKSQIDLQIIKELSDLFCSMVEI